MSSNKSSINTAILYKQTEYVVLTTTYGRGVCHLSKCHNNY